MKPIKPPAAAPRKRASDGPGRRGPLTVNLPAAKTGTGPASGADAPDLRLPHERDQSAVDSTAAAPDPVMVQAAKDLDAGLVDTDLRNTPGLDAARRRKLLTPRR